MAIGRESNAAVVKALPLHIKKRLALVGNQSLVFVVRGLVNPSDFCDDFLEQSRFTSLICVLQLRLEERKGFNSKNRSQTKTLLPRSISQLLKIL